jgi:hypothetical protein
MKEILRKRRTVKKSVWSSQKNTCCVGFHLNEWIFKKCLTVKEYDSILERKIGGKAHQFK